MCASLLAWLGVESRSKLMCVCFSSIAWRGGLPDSGDGRCVLLDTADGKWFVSNCGNLSDFMVCQCWGDPVPAVSKFSIVTFVSTFSQIFTCSN